MTNEELLQITDDKLVEKFIGSWVIAMEDIGPVPPLEVRQRAKNAHAQFKAELLCRLGAAVSASPQPRCPKCNHREISFWGAPDSRFSRFINCHSCKTQFAIGDMTLEEMAKFFAAAPAQEPDSDLLARYNRAYSILGEALNLNAEFYGLVEMAQVAANRLTGKYDSAAQEQPVENSTTCEKCDRKLTRKPADRHNWYDLTGSTRCEATDYKLRHSPQKGKP